MTKAKAPPTTEAVAPPDPVAEVSRMVAVAAGEDPRAMIYVTRKDPKDGKEKHVVTYTPDRFDVETVREEYGGGDYRARVKAHDGTWRAGSVGFSIEGEPRMPMPPLREAPRMPWTAPEPSSDDNLLRTLLVALVQRTAAPAGPTFDPVAFATAMATAQTQAMEQLAAIVGLRKDLEPRREPEPFERMMEMLRFGMELGEKRAEGGGDGMGAVATALTKFVELASKAREHGAPHPAQLTPPPAPTPSAEPPPMHPIQRALMLLLPVAQGGSERAEAWAEVASEQVAGLDEALIEAVERAGSVAAFLDMAPAEVNAHRNFFARVVEYLTAPDDDDDVVDDEPPPDYGEHAGAVIVERAGGDDD